MPLRNGTISGRPIFRRTNSRAYAYDMKPPPWGNAASITANNSMAVTISRSLSTGTVTSHRWCTSSGRQS